MKRLNATACQVLAAYQVALRDEAPVDLSEIQGDAESATRLLRKRGYLMKRRDGSGHQLTPAGRQFDTSRP